MINIYFKKLVDSEAVSSLLILLPFSSVLFLLMVGSIFEFARVPILGRSNSCDEVVYCNDTII